MTDTRMICGEALMVVVGDDFSREHGPSLRSAESGALEFCPGQHSVPPPDSTEVPA